MISSQIIIKLPSEDKEKIRIAEEKIREELKDKTVDINQDNIQSENKIKKSNQQNEVI